MRISDWSSDVCSSDLRDQILALLDLADMRLRRGLYLGEFGLKRDDAFLGRGRIAEPGRSHRRHPRLCDAVSRKAQRHREHQGERDRNSVVEGKGWAVRVDLGGRHNIKKKKIKRTKTTN